MTDAQAIKKLSTFPLEIYLRAFRDLHLSPYDLAMLRSHYVSPEQTITATQLAQAVGFSRFSASNLHYGKLARRVANYIDIHPTTVLLVLVTMKCPEGEWEWTLRPQVVEALEQLDLVKTKPVMTISEATLFEGTIRRAEINTYERNLTARRQCIECYGTACVICGFDFGLQFGEFAESFIHVHHEVPLSEIGSQYEVDPIRDLKPVCPNCHAALHMRDPVFSISEIKGLLEARLINAETN